MKQFLPWVAFVVCSLLLVLGWLLSRPPTDDALIRQFGQHRDTLQQMVAQTQRDRVNVFIRRTDQEPNGGFDAERFASYQAWLREANVSSVSSLGGSSTVMFQVRQPLPIGPIKTYRYSPTPPATVTDGPLEGYRFEAGQYQHVCRPLADDWYLCIDYED